MNSLIEKYSNCCYTSVSEETDTEGRCNDCKEMCGLINYIEVQDYSSEYKVTVRTK